ncbi:hypothetical protein PS013_23995, partial [Shigella sonnei]|nr:hypothetical protein [Shigella sonnei]
DDLVSCTEVCSASLPEAETIKQVFLRQETGIAKISQIRYRVIFFILFMSQFWCALIRLEAKSLNLWHSVC